MYHCSELRSCSGSEDEYYLLMIGSLPMVVMWWTGNASEDLARVLDYVIDMNNLPLVIIIFLSTVQRSVPCYNTPKVYLTSEQHNATTNE
jgi:hypothetical protein